IYEENHSFDNLYGGWEGVNGLNNVHVTGSGDHVTQVQQDAARTPLACLPQDDVNLQAPLAADRCATNTNLFSNKPFVIDNHQWLIAAATPFDPTGAAGGAHAGLHSILDANNFPLLRSPPASQLATALYTSPATGGLNDAQLTQNCPATNGLACGNYGVNTMQ